MLLHEAEVQEPRRLVDCDSLALLGAGMVPDSLPGVRTSGRPSYHCALVPRSGLSSQPAINPRKSMGAEK